MSKETVMDKLNTLLNGLKGIEELWDNADFLRIRSRYIYYGILSIDGADYAFFFRKGVRYEDALELTRNALAAMPTDVRQQTQAEEAGYYVDYADVYPVIIIEREPSVFITALRWWPAAVLIGAEIIVAFNEYNHYFFINGENIVHYKGRHYKVPSLDEVIDLVIGGVLNSSFLPRGKQQYVKNYYTR